MDTSTLFSLIPDYYENSELTYNILNAFAKQFTKLQTKYENADKQLSYHTADTDLYRWEQDFGIPINNNYATDYRRTKIDAKFKGQGTVTEQVIKDVIKSFGNGDVEISTIPSQYTLIIKFVSTKGIPGNLDDLKDALDTLKTADWTIEYQFMYNTWQNILDNNPTWQDVLNNYPIWQDVLDN